MRKMNQDMKEIYEMLSELSETQRERVIASIIIVYLGEIADALRNLDENGITVYPAS